MTLISSGATVFAALVAAASMPESRSPPSSSGEERVVAQAAQDAQPAALDRHPGLVDAATVVEDLLVDLRYSTPENFTGRVLYRHLKRCYLQKDVAAMLGEAAAALRRSRPELRLLAYDCARPRSVQLAMWNVVQGTPQQGYVANPHGGTGSMHNLGCAVDLTLALADGSPLDMGTPFDHFGATAQPRKEKDLLKAGKLTHEQVANRLLLREAMVRAGFYPLGHEWWHFNGDTPAAARRRYKVIP